MSSKAYLCVGGPLDGCLHENNTGARHFHFHINEAPKMVPIKDIYENAAVPVTRITYEQCDIHFKDGIASMWIVEGTGQKRALEMLMEHYVRAKH